MYSAQHYKKHLEEEDMFVLLSNNSLTCQTKALAKSVRRILNYPCHFLWKRRGCENSVEKEKSTPQVRNDRTSERPRWCCLSWKLDVRWKHMSQYTFMKFQTKMLLLSLVYLICLNGKTYLHSKENSNLEYTFQIIVFIGCQISHDYFKASRCEH